MVILIIPYNAHSFIGGAAQIPYLIRLVTENIKRYQQLRMMINQAKNRDNYMRLINEGINNAVGVILNLPIKDEGILAELEHFKDAMEAIEELYGVIPNSKESKMFLLHDRTVAESIKLINASKKYAKVQEQNASQVYSQAVRASPKGAQRMVVVTNSQILHTLSQLVRINGQMLKLQSEKFASKNKEGKDSVGHFNKINYDIGQGLKHYKGDFKLPRF